MELVVTSLLPDLIRTTNLVIHFLVSLGAYFAVEG